MNSFEPRNEFLGYGPIAPPWGPGRKNIELGVPIHKNAAPRYPLCALSTFPHSVFGVRVVTDVTADPFGVEPWSER